MQLRNYKRLWGSMLSGFCCMLLPLGTYQAFAEQNPAVAEDGSNYSGTVLALLGQPSTEVDMKAPFVTGDRQRWFDGKLIYTSFTKLTDESAQSNKYDGLSGRASVTIRRNFEDVTVFPVQLNIDDWITDVKTSVNLGHNVILRIGGTDRADVANLYVFNPELHLFKRFAKEITCPIMSISRDGHYVACLRGGDIFGNPMDQSSTANQVQLVVINIDSGEETIVARNNNIVSTGWDWAPDGNLVYGALSGRDKPTDKKASEKPNLYEFNLATRKSTLLVRDAWRPLVSPGGERICFFGSADPKRAEPLTESWASRANGAELCICQRDGSKRQILNREQGEYPELQWQSASRLISSNSKLSGSSIRTQFSSYSVETLKKRFITTLVTDASLIGDTLEQRYSTILKPISLLGQDKSSKTLVFSRTRWGVLNGRSGRYNKYVDVMELDTQNGSIQNLGTVQNSASNVAWYVQE